MSFKITFVGAGVGFTRKLLSDLMTFHEFHGVDIWLTDVSEENMEMVRNICQRDLDANNVGITIRSTTDRRMALVNAKYVFIGFRIGGLEAFSHDVEIPLKYGVDQCVGDTICAGGIMYGQRGIAVILDVCKDVREVAAPGVIMLNYANPNAMITWAANKYGGVKMIGLCHGVQNGHGQIARALGYAKDEVDIICAGINHQTWYISVKHKGEDLTDKILAAFEADDHLRAHEPVRIDMLRNFGYYSTESNGHLSEYVAWYRKRPQELHKWVNMDEWITGETCGYLRFCNERRNKFVEDYPRYMAELPIEYKPENRSVEHGSVIIEAIETGRVYRGHFNVMNYGCITNLPDECVVEVPGYVDANGVNIPKVGELPLGCAAVCSQSVWVQRLAVEAAVAGDIALLRQAMLMDPLTGAVCTPAEIFQMIDEMLVAQAQWLPQYAGEVEFARIRLADENKRVPYHPAQGMRLV